MCWQYSSLELLWWCSWRLYVTTSSLSGYDPGVSFPTYRSESLVRHTYDGMLHASVWEEEEEEEEEGEEEEEEEEEEEKKERKKKGNRYSRVRPYTYIYIYRSIGETDARKHSPSFAFGHLSPNAARTVRHWRGTLSSCSCPPTLLASCEKFGY